MISEALQYAQRPKVLMFGLGLAVLCLVAYFVIVKDILNLRNQGNVSDQGEWENMMANKFYTSGHTGLGGYFEDQSSLVKLAKEVGSDKRFKQVCAAYFKQFQQNLGTEISKWLNTKEIDQFYKNLGA